MATSFAWLSVMIKQGQNVVKGRTIVKCSWEDTFGSLLERFDDLSDKSIEKIQISRNETFIDPVHVVPIDAPVSLCDQFSCANVCVYISSDSTSSGMSGANAFDRLMADSREIVLPPALVAPRGSDLRMDQLLYNDLLGVLSTLNVGWRPDSVQTTGVHFLRKLSKCLWYLDPHHYKFTQQGLHIPHVFSSFTGYNDFKKKKQKPPRISSEELTFHVHELSSVLMQPWFGARRFELLRKDVENLVESMEKYKAYLCVHTEKVKVRQSELTLSPQEDNASLVTLSGSGGPTSSVYSTLEQQLAGVEMYHPIFVNELAPTDRLERRKWISAIQLPFSIMLYRYAYGNHLGTLTYVWKIPENQPLDNTIVSRIFTQLNGQHSHCTRAMRQDFLDKYRRVAKLPTMVLRHIYRTLLGDCSSAEYASEAVVDERITRALLDVNDPDIVLDLRRSNGKPNSTTFDTFWCELQSYLDEINPAVDERRHGDALHMPFAISVRHLQEIIVERLQRKFPDSMPPIPSLEWIRLQFWPSNSYTNTALRYTGRFNVKFGVQVRQLRKEHPDSHYVSALLQYVRNFSVQFREHLMLVSVDEKAIIPVGEPGCHVSTGVRGHNRSLVAHSGPQLEALDHDFHVHGIVPSVSFFIDIPENASDSFYRGHPFVTNKDKVPEPSSALRHSTEMTHLIRTHYSDVDHCNKPVLVIVSDGGPDHRVTFGSVKVACLTLFRAVDLDMLICVRTCPYQSWTNVAERVMSTLNLALQNVSLARTAMVDQFERLVKNKNSLADIREAIRVTPDLGPALLDSMSAPLVTVSQRFQAMKVKDNKVQVGVAASQADLDMQFQHVLFIDPSLEKDKLTGKDLANANSLQKFMKSHCHSSSYVFQVKKCMEPACFYCNQHPIRLPVEKFLELNYLPLPLLDTSKEHYQKFGDVFGKPISSADQPSLVAVPTEEQKKIDKDRKSLLVATKVRTVITCGECSKARCIYANTTLTSDEQIRITSVKESKVYTCGSPLFPADSNSIVVREALVCSSPIEAQYYSAKLVHFPPVCSHCGLGEADNPELQELRKCYAVVLPICFTCLHDGKKPQCKKPSNVVKKRKTS